MKHLKKFESFSESKILYLFDFDETLVNTPRFEDVAIKYLGEKYSIGEILDHSAGKIGISSKDFKVENGKIYIDYSDTIEIKSPWVRKGDRIYLTAPQHHWTHSEDSLPKDKLELSKLYNSVEEKAIITARPDTMRSEIESKMKELNLEVPKWGLHMFPLGSGAGNPGLWKGNVAVSLIEKSGIDNVKFYDDKSKIVNRVVKIVREQKPGVNITGIKV